MTHNQDESFSEGKLVIPARLVEKHTWQGISPASHFVSYFILSPRSVGNYNVAGRPPEGRGAS